MYNVPEKYFYRIHHVRPRFKNDIENVLIFMATQISQIGEKPSLEFKELINSEIRKFPGNLVKTEKTINNWRTEISALFGFYVKDIENNLTYPGLRAEELAAKQDLIESFKKFLYFFQYPGGHLKTHENKYLIENGIRFKPAKYILELLQYAEKNENRRIGLNKAELTHCILNDLRCTSENETVSNSWDRIKENRLNKSQYDWSGDVVRYAGDILDYMETANLLVSHGSDFYLNHLEDIAIQKFCSSDNFFTNYDEMISARRADLQELKICQNEWFEYVNQPISEDFFETDVLALIAEDEADYISLKKSTIELFEASIEADEVTKTQDIGNWGESLVHGHECTRIKINGREDLVHLIKRIPTQFAVGYDIKSVETDGTMRLIEVKTTISSKPIDFTKFHLTPNEWSAAESFRERYHVYRLYFSKHSKKLYVLSDPVGLYKTDKLQMIPRNGADVVFDTNKCGQYEELLEWAN